MISGAHWIACSLNEFTTVCSTLAWLSFLFPCSSADVTGRLSLDSVGSVHEKQDPLSQGTSKYYNNVMIYLCSGIISN